MSPALTISLPSFRSDAIQDVIQDILARRDEAIVCRYHELKGRMNWEEAREETAREFGVSDSTVRRAIYGS